MDGGDWLRRQTESETTKLNVAATTSSFWALRHMLLYFPWPWVGPTLCKIRIKKGTGNQRVIRAILKG